MMQMTNNFCFPGWLVPKKWRAFQQRLRSLKTRELILRLARGNSHRGTPVTLEQIQKYVSKQARGYSVSCTCYSRLCFFKKDTLLKYPVVETCRTADGERPRQFQSEPSTLF